MNSRMCASILLFLLNLPVQAMVISNSGITATGSFNPPYTPEQTIDDDLTTFWHGTNNLQIGDIDYLIYRFTQPYSINQIDLYNDFHDFDDYALGELSLQISIDSTNGLDGTWLTVASIPGDFGAGDFSIFPFIGPTEWVRLQMEYQGRGAWGGSPAFYLSEIDFHGRVPEPMSLALLGLGLTGLVFTRYKRRI